MVAVLRRHEQCWRDAVAPPVGGLHQQPRATQGHDAHPGAGQGAAVGTDAGDGAYLPGLQRGAVGAGALPARLSRRQGDGQRGGTG
jgi:hypothetical protein